MKYTSTVSRRAFLGRSGTGLGVVAAASLLDPTLLQAAPQKAWAGKAENVPAAQKAFNHRAKMNGLASKGQWNKGLEG